MSTLYVPHQCHQPWTLVNGTIWQCEGCQAIWLRKKTGNPNYAAWHKLGRIGRWLHGVS